MLQHAFPGSEGTCLAFAVDQSYTTESPCPIINAVEIRFVGNCTKHNVITHCAIRGKGSYGVTNDDGKLFNSCIEALGADHWSSNPGCTIC